MSLEKGALLYEVYLDIAISHWILPHHLSPLDEHGDKHVDVKAKTAVFGTA
jgi:hypothetical protein